MQKPKTFAEVLNLWKTHAALKDELGVIYVTAQAMRTRGSIGDEHWPKVIEAWKRRGVTLTEADMLAMRRKRRAENRRKAKRAPAEGQAA